MNNSRSGWRSCHKKMGFWGRAGWGSSGISAQRSWSERVFPGSSGIHGVWPWGRAALSWFGGGSWSSGGTCDLRVSPFCGGLMVCWQPRGAVWGTGGGSPLQSPLLAPLWLWCGSETPGILRDRKLVGKTRGLKSCSCCILSRFQVLTRGQGRICVKNSLLGCSRTCFPQVLGGKVHPGFVPRSWKCSEPGWRNFGRWKVALGALQGSFQPEHSVVL